MQSALRLRAGFALCLSLSLVSCSSVLGLDKYEVTDEQAGGSGGNGGSAGAAGSTSGGSAGLAGSAGTGGTPNCDAVPEPNEDVIRSCLLRTSCSPFVSNISISTCVTVNYQRAFLGTSCTLAAQDCEDVEVCQGYGYAGDACASQTGFRCENNIAYDCANNVFLDCSTRGGSCVLYDSDGDLSNDSAGCRVIDCSDPQGTTRCEGNTLYTCFDGDGIGTGCSALQAECRVQGGQAGCFLRTRETCNMTGGTCEGATARLCSGGALLEFDCASVGLACSDEPGGPYCVAPGCSLQQAAGCEESCDGSTLNLCYGGVTYPVDCTDYGFTRCRMVMDPTPGGLGNYATCN